jgi:hypothetical protein
VNQSPRVRTTATAFTYNPGTGDLTTNGNVTAYSDEKLKDNIKTIENALEKVLQIRGVSYVRKDLECKDRRYIGVIAQEVEKVLPEVVDKDDSGNMTIAYGNMIGLLIEAIKDLKNSINKLEQKLVNYG